MSLGDLILDQHKPWLNARVNNLTVDGSFNIVNLGSTITLTGNWQGLAFTTSPAGTIILNKVGRQVFVWVKSAVAIGAGGTQEVFSIVVPAAYLPQIDSGGISATAITMMVPLIVNNNQTNSGRLTIDGLTGDITIDFNIATVGAVNGWLNLTGSYRSAT